VFRAVHEGNADPKVLAYQYLQTLPQLAQAEGNTFWVIPSEVTGALKSLSTAFTGSGESTDPPAARSLPAPVPNGEAARAQEAARARQEVAQVEREVAAVQQEVAKVTGTAPLLAGGSAGGSQPGSEPDREPHRQQDAEG
jgi:hypothetical protein